MRIEFIEFMWLLIYRHKGLEYLMSLNVYICQ